VTDQAKQWLKRTKRATVQPQAVEPHG
jgi:hypothetical protein